MKNILLPEQIEYLESMRNPEDELILEMEKFALEKRIPILDWKSAAFLEQMIRIQKPREVLEIGTAIAYSSIRIARSLRKKGRVTTIEKSRDNIKLAQVYIERSSFPDKIELLNGDALDIMPEMDRKFDFIFLDADKEDYARLFRLSLKLLRKKGVIFVDNLLWHGYTAAREVPQKFANSTRNVRDFNRIFLSEPELNSEIYPIGDGIGIGIKKK